MINNKIKLRILINITILISMHRNMEGFKANGNGGSLWGGTGIRGSGKGLTICILEYIYHGNILVLAGVTKSKKQFLKGK